jgi:hypothetical protein
MSEPRRKEDRIMEKDKRSIMPGLVMAGVGFWLLARNLSFTSPVWFKVFPVLMLLFSAALLWEYGRTKKQAPLFWGTAAAAVGLFYLTVHFGFMPDFFFDEFWPVLFLAMGAGFLARFISRPRDWGLLFPAGLFMFIGAESALHSMDDFWADRLERMLDYWPAALILLGLGLIAGGLRKEK